MNPLEVLGSGSFVGTGRKMVIIEAEERGKMEFAFKKQSFI